MDALRLPARQRVLLVCLFIGFAYELIWNVLVNQKGFVYITVAPDRVLSIGQIELNCVLMLN